MPNNGYMPNTEAGQATFSQTFATCASAHPVATGLSEAQIDAFKA